ncbi:hypothetical protein ABVT39_003909 [Epinephelus coioides]
MRPFDIVTGKGFAQVAQRLITIGSQYGAVDIDAILPHQQIVCDRAKLLAATDKEKLSEHIQKVMEDSGIAVTIDMWTDEFNKRAYTVLTCHYINEKWHLESRILATVEFDCLLKKTGENIHDQITTVLMNYGISPDKVVFVSDQGPNIKSALRSYHWIPCTAHMLNTKTGAVASLAHTVIQECEVCWNSKVNMLESVLKHYGEIRQLLDEKDQLHRMEGIYQDQLVHLIEFLTLFITGLEGEKYPTIHTVLLWFHKLKKHCQPKFGVWIQDTYLNSALAHPACLTRKCS